MTKERVRGAKVGVQCSGDPGIDLGGAHGERVEREPTTGVWGRSPQRGPGAEPLVGGSGGEAPMKLKAFELSSIQ